MKIDFYERFFLWLTGLTLVIFFAAMVVSAFGSSVALPQAATQVDPEALAAHPLFSNPGLRQLTPTTYEAVVIGQTWFFTPNEIRIPEGSTVTFHATSRDVIHGFQLTGIPLNMMLIPGQVSVATATFDSPGEHYIICHEYCGLEHHTMYGRIIVEPRTAAQAE